jgi:hypothetical protein
MEIQNVSVICKNKTIASTQNKMFKIFQVGFKKNRLCYINGIYDIVKTFFEI